MTVTHTGRYLLIIAVTLATFAVEVIGHVVSGSLGLASDAAHLIVDNIPLFLGLRALWVRERGKDSSAHERAVTRMNILLLALVAIWIVIEARGRWVNPQEVETNILPFALLGVVGNGLQFYLARGLHSAHMHGHTYRGQVMHLGLDWGGSIAVLLGAIAVAVGSTPRFDTLAAYAVALCTLGGAFVTWTDLISHDKHHHH